MRRQFIECSRKQTAWRRCPWACVIVKADGGYIAFECAEEAARFVGNV